MRTEFDPIELRSRIEQWPAWKQLAFGLSICERLYPNFVAFSKDVSFPGQERLRECIDLGWNNLKNNRLSENYSQAARECEFLAPDTEDYQTILASSALDAAASVSYLMSYFENNDIDLIVEIASLSCDSIDMYVQELEDINSNGDELEMMITAHPLMQAELNRQSSDIKFLNGLDDDPTISCNDLRHSLSSLNRGNLGL